MNILVLITAKDKSQATKIAQALVKERQAACVNILPGVRSLFWWQGKVDAASEVLMLVKTQKKCFKRVVAIVKKLHSYQVPEIIALPIVAGERAYLEWLKASCKH
jgi:periplasmic divalent cation tolerance protein